MAETDRQEPRVLDVLAGEAEETRDTPYGTVGLLFAGPGIRAEWVSKRGEAVDPDWFSQDTVDILCVLAGQSLSISSARTSRRGRCGAGRC